MATRINLIQVFLGWPYNRTMRIREYLRHYQLWIDLTQGLWIVLAIFIVAFGLFLAVIYLR